MEKLKVALGARSYDILIDENALSELPKHLDRSTYIITDKNVAKLHLKRLEDVLDNILYKTKVLPAGEGTKSFQYLEELCSWLLAEKIERKTTIIAFGGGVIGDLVGFAASVLLRGINFIQVPTTLLAQVDSSVGGKTAINSAAGKNLIGSFYQPKVVIADTSLLRSLPPREVLSGHAEIVKYGLINNVDFFNWLNNNDLHDEKNLSKAIYESCQAKAKIVAEDEREAGARALLNLGHTFGHAFEAETGFSSKLLHGEAVALGIIMAFKFSTELGLCSAKETEKVITYFTKIGLPTDPRKYLPELNIDALIGHMKSDKKVVDGKMVFILTRGIGKSFIAEGVEEKNVKTFLEKI